VQATLLTKDGKLVHPKFSSDAAAA
jgi:hypothetical protein